MRLSAGAAEKSGGVVAADARAAYSTLTKRDYDWSKEVAALKLQTMIVFADADAVRPAHIVEFYGLCGGGRKDAGLDGPGRPADHLAILPGLTHYNITASPLLPTVVAPFRDAQSAAKAN